MLYYAGGLLLLILVLFWRRPRKGMRLRLGQGRRSTDYRTQALKGRLGPDVMPPRMNVNAQGGERSINVIFNFNGESWDAFEVFGLPAGSGMATVEAAFKEAMGRADETSRVFLQAAFKAIEENSRERRKGAG